MSRQWKTRKQYEEYLNEMITSSYGQNELIEKYKYLTKNSRVLLMAWYQRRVGSLIRRQDPVLFDVGYSEWSRE